MKSKLARHKSRQRREAMRYAIWIVMVYAIFAAMAIFSKGRI